MNIGDKVTAIAFTDCFKKFSPAVPNLTITSIRHMPAAHGVAAYDRITAEGRGEVSLVEGAERFFELVEPSKMKTFKVFPSDNPVIVNDRAAKFNLSYDEAAEQLYQIEVEELEEESQSQLLASRGSERGL
jgi:hypothetical protein